MPQVLSCSRCCRPTFHVKFLFILTMTLRDSWPPPHLRMVEMGLSEVSGLVWGHVASKGWPGLPKSRAASSPFSLVTAGKAWAQVARSRVATPLKAIAPVV